MEPRGRSCGMDSEPHPSPPVAGAPGGAAIPAPGRAAVVQAVDAAIGRYIAARRERIGPFTRRTFGWRGALSLHRKAVGWDLVRAPANAVAAVPGMMRYAAAQGARAAGYRAAAQRLGAPRLAIATDVAREVEWRLLTDLLELPYEQPDAKPPRRSAHDALAEEILADPAVGPVLLAALAEVGRRAGDEHYRRWLTETMEAYASTRAAAVEMASTLLHAGVGALAFRQWTPGALALGPMIARVVAQRAAGLALPLGTGARVWFAAAPAAASPLLAAGITGGLLLIPALAASFAGVLTDPLQVHLGIHQRRLNRLVDALERELTGSGDSSFVIRDQYVARMVDLIEIARAAVPVR